jgi:outer membrane protein TolC
MKISDLFLSICVLFASMMSAASAQVQLSMEQAVAFAQQNDPWLDGSRHREQAIAAQSVAAGTLPDPVVSIGLANMPTDTFEFDQEAMTQFRVGISQQLPRGDSLALRRTQLATLGKQYPYQRVDRLARVRATVSTLWLDIYKAQRSINLIEENRSLFDQLVDVAKASYAAAAGKTRQQDLIRAQLEVTRLEDRLTSLRVARDSGIARLGEWLGGEFTSRGSSDVKTGELAVSADLPGIELRPVEWNLDAAANGEQVVAHLLGHPAIAALDQRIEASRTGIDLAKQKYKPQWGLSASYAYRDDDPMGDDRADFFSVGVTFDLPMFTASRQDKEVTSAVSQKEAIKAEKTLLLRKMVADFDRGRVRLQRLRERDQLYRDRLLAQMMEQAEASLTAYTNDSGEFSEVVRARIAELNAVLESVDISVEMLKTTAALNYLLVSKEDVAAEPGVGGAL